MGIITFSRTVRVGNSWKNWNTTPTFLPRHLATLFSLIPVNRSPATWTSPEVGRSMPVTMLMRVLFPLPDGPTIATNSPPWICRSTPRSAVNGPAFVLKTFSTFSSLTRLSFIS